MSDKPIFKTMKVFDCQWDPGMPEEVRRAFFDVIDGFAGNDVYVAWDVQHDDTEYYSDDEFAVKRRLVDDWLIENGAVGRNEASPYHGETVLIKHWW